jgi:hypothetical protein
MILSPEQTLIEIGKHLRAANELSNGLFDYVKKLEREIADLKTKASGTENDSK